jgi:hypothetical protein
VTTRREYAASLGLAKPNTRGRLSKEAHEAIAKAEAEGMVFTDQPKAKGGLVIEPVATLTAGCATPLSLPKPKAETIKRHARAYRVTTKAGQVIEFGHCARCRNHVKFCGCGDGPQVPKWLADEVDTWEPVE